MLKYKETCRRTELADPSGSGTLPSLFSDEEMKGIADTNSTILTGIPYRTILVLSPASVVFNWRNELHRFAPQLTACEYIGTIEERRQKRQALMHWNVVLTTYLTLRNDIEYFS